MHTPGDIPRADAVSTAQAIARTHTTKQRERAMRAKARHVESIPGRASGKKAPGREPDKHPPAADGPRRTRRRKRDRNTAKAPTKCIANPRRHTCTLPLGSEIGRADTNESSVAKLAEQPGSELGREPENVEERDREKRREYGNTTAGQDGKTPQRSDVRQCARTVRQLVIFFLSPFFFFSSPLTCTFSSLQNLERSKMSGWLRTQLTS
jgi:hypothetical protein